MPGIVPPYSWDEINLAAGLNRPSVVKNFNNTTFWYWARALYQRAAYTIVFKNLPENWDNSIRDNLYWWLFIRGYVGIFNTKEYGLVFQPGDVIGYDFYYRPRTFRYTNPLVPDYSQEYRIGSAVLPDQPDLDVCEILKLSPDFMGIADIIVFYATKLANLSLSADISIINTRLARILGARNKAAAEALKKILDKINQGDPAVVYDVKLLDDRTDKAEPFQDFQLPSLKENYITDLQLKDIQTLLNAYDVEIGISTVPYQKKERMVVSEAESNQNESKARVTVWLETLTGCLNSVNKTFGTNIRVSLRAPLEAPEEASEEVSDGNS